MERGRENQAERLRQRSSVCESPCTAIGGKPDLLPAMKALSAKLQKILVSQENYANFIPIDVVQL